MTAKQPSIVNGVSNQRLHLNAWLLCAVLLLRCGSECRSDDAMFYRVSSTQPTHILSLDSDGMLVWSNAVSNAVCRIESLPSPLAPPSEGTFTAPITSTGLLMSVRMPMQPGPSPVVLSIYSDGWGTYMETRALPMGQATTIWINETNPYTHPGRYYGFACADDNYTRLYRFTNGESVFIDLDPVPNVPYGMTGVIFGRQHFFSAHYFATNTIDVSGPAGPLPPIMTDQYGRYLLTNADLGTYTLSFTFQDVPFSFDITNCPGTAYQDLQFYDPIQAAAPNIYLYPESATNLAVELDIPNGGVISTSAPPYGSGWNVRVDTNGIINDAFGYLFYEALVPRSLDTAAGWLLDGADLDGGFRDLLNGLGFKGREVDDFVSHWVPIMEGAAWYAVYWEDPAATSALRISPQPQSILRAHFLVRPLERPIAITAPAIRPFVREGFTVVEWGVLGWGQ